MTINRLQITLEGGSMGLGVATHFFDPSFTTAQLQYKTMWTSFASIMSGYVSVTIPNEGEQFDEANGDLTGTWQDGTAATITGGGSGAYAGGVGACVAWSTSGIHYARKVRGRTFVVPLAANTYDADGTLAAGTRTTLNTAAATFLSAAASKALIWCRPDEEGERPIGDAYPIVAGNVADHVSWLRSRR